VGVNKKGDKKMSNQKTREILAQFIANAAHAYKHNDLAASNRIEFDAVQTFGLCSAKVFSKKLKEVVA
jgi:hypothetical protein